MTQLNIQTPRWALPLLNPMRYKGAYGGRGCVHPDTPIDTPSGQIKVKDYKGGEVYSYFKGEKITSYATPAKSYRESQLWLVILTNKKRIIVTDEHKFLTPDGYLKLRELGRGKTVICFDEGTFKKVVIKEIRSQSKGIYYDLHVPYYNNYLSDGIVNHNSGKSHFFAEMLVERHVMEPNTNSVCIREIQKSLKLSAKKLIEDKIRALGVQDMFKITQTEITSKIGHGMIIFQGMQDHTADSIKSLEGFDVAWCEEAQTMSKRSLQLLRPTIRKEGSEIWFSWNPDQPTDPVDEFFRGEHPPEDSVAVMVNYDKNPFLPKTLYLEMLSDMQRDADTFAHVWEGGYNQRTDSLVLGGKWEIDEFEPRRTWERPYFGVDWGFSKDPLAVVKMWFYHDTLYIEDELYSIGVELDTLGSFLDRIKGTRKHTLRADSSRPETISHVKNMGFNITGVPKWKNMVEDGVAWLRGLNSIVVHPRCVNTIRELRLYSYKICKMTGDILPDILDENNHAMDAIRYGMDPLIRARKQYNIRVL